MPSVPFIGSAPLDSAPTASVFPLHPPSFYTHNRAHTQTPRSTAGGSQWTSGGASAQSALTRQRELPTCTPRPAKQNYKYKKIEKKTNREEK